MNNLTIQLNHKKIKAVLLIIIAIVVICCKTNAQSLGDPIVNISFGSGSGNFSGPLAADSGSTTYIYQNGAPSDGHYTITNTTSELNDGWWTTTDHTGNPGGYMMIVNGSFAPGVFYTRTVNNLCLNTTYQFGAWIKNILNYSGILPNVTFRIETTDGTILRSGDTHDISITNEWIQYAFNFTTPPGTESVVIKMINNAPGGLGNDIAIDDITFRAYGPPVSALFDQSSTSKTFCVGTVPNININTATPPTSNYVQKLQLRVNGVWTDESPAGTGTSYDIPSPAAGGTYYYRVVSAQVNNIASPQCVLSSNVLTLNVANLPVAAFSETDNIYLGELTYFKDQSVLNGGTIKTWQWDFGDGKTSTEQNPTHLYTSSGDFTVHLTVTSDKGCDNAIDAKISVLPIPIIPNTFTPNSDGFNDTWNIKNLEMYTGCTVKVYNRYGVKVFSSNEYPIPWNGRYNGINLPAGVYYYIIDPKHGRKLISGPLTIIW